MLTSHMEMKIITTFEPELAHCTDKGFFLEMAFEMTLEVRFSGKTSTTKIAVVRFDVFVESFVKLQKTLHFEIFRTKLTFEWSCRGMGHEMAVQVFLGSESLLTVFKVAEKVENFAVGRFMSFFVSFLDESFAADRAFVRLFSCVQIHVPVQAELFGKVLAANVAAVTFWFQWSFAIMARLVLYNRLSQKH